MRVWQLIEQLEKLPLNMPVRVDDELFPQVISAESVTDLAGVPGLNNCVYLRIDIVRRSGYIWPATLGRSKTCFNSG